MRLSKLASEIAESPTLALNEEARQLRERGEPVTLGAPESEAASAIVSIAEAVAGSRK